MAFGGVGLGVPVAMGDGHGNGQGPDGAGPPGQLAKQNGAAAQGQGNAPGHGNGQGQGNGQGRGNGQPQTPAHVILAAHDQGNGNNGGNGNGTGHHGQGRGPSGDGPPGQGNGSGHGHQHAGVSSTSNGNGDGPPGQVKKDNQPRGGAAGGPRAAAAATTGTGPVQQGNQGNAAPAAASGSGAGHSTSTTSTRFRSNRASATADTTTIAVPAATTQATAQQPSSQSSASASTVPSANASDVGPLAITSAGTTGLLTAGTGAGAAGGSGPIVGKLAPGTTGIGAHAAATRHGAHSTGQHVHITIKQIVPDLVAVPGTVIHFISVIPTGVWIALAVALALALGAGTAAFRSRRQVRLQASEVAAVTAAALTDPLTGVLNRRGFLEAGERELDRARRYGHPLALAFVDIRGLKAVNDTEGHLAGDKLLRRVTMLLRESARTHDLVGRIGGDELAVLLAEQSADGAEAMTQRVRAQIPAYRASLGLVTGWDVTIGTSTFPEDGDELEQLLDAADRRLYLQRGIDLAK